MASDFFIMGFVDIMLFVFVFLLIAFGFVKKKLRFLSALGAMALFVMGFVYFSGVTTLVVSLISSLVLVVSAWQ